MAILFTSEKKEFVRPEKKKLFESAVKFWKIRELPNIDNATQNEKNAISFWETKPTSA